MTPQGQIAPLSPQLQSQFATGGTTTQSNASGSASPSESAPSAPGGGGRTVDACMGFWDSGTHMSKAEWKAACVRIQNRLDNLKVDNLRIGAAAKR